MDIRNTPARLFAPADAVAQATILQADEEDGWTYRVPNPDGALGPYSAIEVIDEDGESLGFVS